jgi:hypothetical protein
VRASVVLLCVLVVTSLAAGAATSASGPNVRGKLVRSSAITGCYQGEPCDPPPQASFLLFTRNGHSTRVRLGATGVFAVRLAAGVYKVRTLPSSTVSPASMRVPRTGVIHPRFVQKAG